MLNEAESIFGWQQPGLLLHLLASAITLHIHILNISAPPAPQPSTPQPLKPQLMKPCKRRVVLQQIFSLSGKITEYVDFDEEREDNGVDIDDDHNDDGDDDDDDNDDDDTKLTCADACLPA